MSLTTDKNDLKLNKKKPDGQHEAYLVLPDEERAKGFIRPVRKSYVHVGKQIDESKIIPIDLYFLDNDQYSEERKRQFKEDFKYVGYMPYRESESPILGRFITQNDLEEGCYGVTTMSTELAETYAREPKFYGATFCAVCRKHLPVEEFIWQGTNERVGS